MSNFRIFNEIKKFYPTILTFDDMPTTGEDALQLLIDGNARFVNETPLIVNESRIRVQATQNVQNPFATILSCCDSREPVSSLFKRGVGDIFNIRKAGNNMSGLGIYGSLPNNSTVDNCVIGSVEFSLLGLTTQPKIIVMMCHTNCGAVNASYEWYQQNGTNDPVASSSDQLGYIITGIKSASRQALDENPVGSYNRAAQYNVDNNLNFLRDNSTTINSYMNEQDRLVYGAIYNTETGIVEFAKYDVVLRKCDWVLK